MVRVTESRGRLAGGTDGLQEKQTPFVELCRRKSQSGQRKAWRVSAGRSRGGGVFFLRPLAGQAPGPPRPPRPPRPFPPPGDLSRGSAGPAHPLHSHRRIAPSRPGPLEHNTPASPRAAEGTPPRAAALASRSGTGEDGRALSFRREAAHSRRPRRLPEAGARLSWGRVPAAGSKLKRFCVSPHPPGSRRRQA